jgi:hypothetical protein
MKSRLSLLVVSALLISGCAQGDSNKSTTPKLTAAEAKNQRILKNCDVLYPRLDNFIGSYATEDYYSALDAISYRSGSLSVLTETEEEYNLRSAVIKGMDAAAVLLNAGKTKDKLIDKFIKDSEMYLDYCNDLALKTGESK